MGFYGVNFPQQKISVGDRFFFFNSLKNETQQQDEFGHTGADLANIASSILNSKISNFKPESENGLNLIKSVLRFLQNMIQYEREQELTYFKDKFEKIDLPGELKQRFQKIFNQSNSSIDYIEFINLINILYVGKENYATILSYEQDRLDKINTLINNYLKDTEEHYVRITKNGKEIDRVDKGFYANFRDYAIRKKEYWANNTTTFSNGVQKVIEEAITSMWKTAEWQTILSNFLSQYNYNHSMRNIQQILTINLMNSVMGTIKNNVIEYLRNKNNFKNVINQTELKKIIKSAATEYLDTIQAEENPHDTEQFLRLLDKQIKELENNSLDNDTKRQLQIVNPAQIQKKKKGSEEVIKIAKEVKDAMIKEIRAHGGKANTKTKNDELIQKFLEKYANIDAYQFKNMNNEDIVSIITNFSSSYTPFIDFRIAGKDNVISEAFSIGDLHKLKKSPFIISSIGLEGGYQKADIYGVENIEIGSIICNLNSSAVAATAQRLSQQITDKFFKSTEIAIDPVISKTTIFNEAKFRADKKFGGATYGTTEFSIAAETQRRLAYLQQICDEVKQSLKEAKATNETIDTFLRGIKDTVQISGTVKSYNKYQNNEGFHGGSLGGDGHVEAQLANIYKMYEYGGIDMPDMEWMIFAVYNSGDNMLGSENREPIEKILSSAAGMLLFDDAGQEALYVQSQAKENYSGMRNFLHLYYLNDLYFPSSYVLQLTYNGLVEAYNLLETEFQEGILNTGVGSDKSQGARIHIENNVSEPAQGIAVNWNNFFNENKKNVNVNIVFLAGLLDIIKVLNENLNIQ